MYSYAQSEKDILYFFADNNTARFFCFLQKGEEGDSDKVKGVIAVSGAFALYPMMQIWAEDFRKTYPDVEFDISAGGAGKGMADTLSGTVDIGMVSRAVSPEEEGKGAYWVPVVKDAVFPMMNTDNPVYNDIMAKGLSKEVFTGIYITGEIKTWGQAVGRSDITDEILVYTRSDACGAAETWAKFMGKKQENLLGIGITSDPGLLDAVVRDRLGIGFNNLNYAYDAATGDFVTGAAAIPIDKADPEEIMGTKKDAVDRVASGDYPSPPARLLNLVTKGKPSGVTALFIEWTLTEGQGRALEAGYVPLTEAQQKEALEKIR